MTTTPEPIKLFVVVEGCYSDVSNVGIFSDRDVAEKCAKKCDGWIDEFTLDQLRDLTLSGLNPYTVSSKLGSIEVAVVAARSFGAEPEPVFRYSGGIQLGVTVLARDRDHAIKIAADKFREFVALGN